MPESLKRYDAAVIGGGPAGAAASILLARAGRNVILLEKTLHATDKVCGEFISWEAAHYLSKLDIDLPAIGAHPIENLRLINDDTILEKALPFPAWSLSRRLLDEALLGIACDAGAEVTRGKNVIDLSRKKDDWLLKTSSAEYFHAENVFLASGKHELRGWKRESRQNHGPIGFKMHFRLAQRQSYALRNHVEVIIFNGGYAGLELTENDTANLCFLITKDIYKACGKNWEDLLSWLKSEVRHLALRLEHAIPLWKQPLTIYNLPYGYIFKPEDNDPGLFRLGDQMAVISSFSGDGIAMALHSAFLASSIYLSGGHANYFHKYAERDFKGPVRSSQFLGTLLSNPLSRKTSFGLLQLFPALLPRAIFQTRLNGTVVRALAAFSTPSIR